MISRSAEKYLTDNDKEELTTYARNEITTILDEHTTHTESQPESMDENKASDQDVTQRTNHKRSPPIEFETDSLEMEDM